MWAETQLEVEPGPASRFSPPLLRGPAEAERPSQPPSPIHPRSRPSRFCLASRAAHLGPTVAHAAHRTEVVFLLDTEPKQRCREGNPPLRLSSRESASDQNQMRIEIKSASNTSSREKIPIKGVAPDQFLVEPKRATLVTAAAIAKSKRGRPSSTIQSRRIPRAPLICPTPQFDRRAVEGRHHWLPWNREGAHRRNPT
jgi:hypothetical protein